MVSTSSPTLEARISARYPNLSPVTTPPPDWQRLGLRRRASSVRPDSAWRRKSLTASDPKTVVSDRERAWSLVKLLPVERVSATSVVGDGSSINLDGMMGDELKKNS
jgi:hypothetical protein